MRGIPRWAAQVIGLLATLAVLLWLATLLVENF
jgi:hypothetical protein